jgi:hypothetical protein
VGSVAFQNGRKWTLAVGALVCVHIAATVLVRRSFALTAFGDILQNLILLASAALFLNNFRLASPRNRLFWA